jgi:recombination protein RecA
MAKSKVKEEKTSDDILDSLILAVNNKFKDSQGLAVASFLADPGVPTEVTDWIESGCSVLDLAISNRPNGGYPVGKIIELTGLEASGKSLLGAYALANTQKKGGVAVYIDTESAVTKAYMEAIGVDVEKLIYLQLETLEDIFTAVEEIIAKVRSSNKNKLVTILIDSVMGATTNKEHDSDFSKDGYATDKALILSKAMRKITNLINKQKVCLIITNQLRQKLGVTFGQQYTTSGGKAIGFHSSVRIRLSAVNKIKIKTTHGDEIIGIRTQAEVFKNRLGPPLKKVEYDIYFNSGIDNYGSWLTMLKTYKLVSSAGQYYTLKLDQSMDIIDPTTAELTSLMEIKFTSKQFAKYLEVNSNLKSYIYNLMCNELIVKYVLNEDFSVDEVEIDKNVASILDED